MTDRLAQLDPTEREAFDHALAAINHGVVPIDAFAAAALAYDVDWRVITGPFILAGVDAAIQRKTSGRLTLADMQAALAPDERTSP